MNRLTIDSIYERYDLPNGLRIVHMPTHSPVGYCGFVVNAGARDEQETEHGLAHFVEHMLFKGTEQHKANYILNRMEAVGGELNAYTTKEETFIYSIFMSEHFRRAFGLLFDIVFHSQFPETQIKKEKDVILDEISSYEDSPSELIFDDFENLLFKGHHLGHNILGNETTLDTFDAPMGKTFMHNFYTPDNMVFFSMGKMDIAPIVGRLNRLMEDFPACHHRLNRKAPETVEPSTVYLHKDTHQSHVMIGSRAYSMYDKKRFSLYLLNNILGGPGMNNRLNVSLREHNGLVYNVESNIASYTDTGVFSIYFGTDPKHKERAMHLVHRELEKFRNIRLTERQLNAAKRQALGQLGISEENKEALFLNMGKNFLHYNHVDTLGEIRGQIELITAEAIQDIANELFAPENLFTLIYE